MGKKVISLQPLHSQKAAQQTAGKRILPSEAIPHKPSKAPEKAPNSGTLPHVLSRLPLLQVPLTSKYYLTVREAAALAGLPVAHIRRAIADAVLPALRSGGYRIKREDLERL